MIFKNSKKRQSNHSPNPSLSSIGPPPPYSSATSPAFNGQRPSQPEAQHPHHLQACTGRMSHQNSQVAPHTMHFNRDGGFLSRDLVVYDSAPKVPRYKVEVHTWSKPTIVIGSTATSIAIANIDFHTMSSRIDVQIQNHEFTMENLTNLGRSYIYRSPTFNGLLQWKSEGWLSGGDATCFNDRNVPLARLHVSGMSRSNEGILGIAGQASAQGAAAVEELVVTALAMLEMWKRISRSSGNH